MSDTKNVGESTIRYNMMGVRIALHDFKLKEKNKIGNIYMVNGEQTELSTALVVATGPDVKHIKCGDFVVTPYGVGTHVEDGDVKYRILPEEAIMAVDNEFDEVRECE